MKARSAGIAVGIVALCAFFLLPFVPFSTPGRTAFAALDPEANAAVSPSFVVLGCGVVYNPTLTTGIAGDRFSQPVWDGARWACGTGWTGPLQPA